MPAAPAEPRSRHLDPRLLRAFLAVAEELHFTRAAARLYVAQQALSRDVRRLERELGAELFVRTTRQVTLTADGERLLPYARRVLEAQDELLAAFRAGAARPLLVDLNCPGLRSPGAGSCTGPANSPRSCELMARYESGLTGRRRRVAGGAARRLLRAVRRARPGAAGRGSTSSPCGTSRWRSLLPEDHPLAALDAVPLAALAGETRVRGGREPAYAGVDRPRAPPVRGAGHRGRAARAAGRGRRGVPNGSWPRRGTPILAVVDFPAMPGTVLRPLIDPVPLSPVSLVWRKGLVHPGFDALRRGGGRTRRSRRGGCAGPQMDGFQPSMQSS